MVVRSRTLIALFSGAVLGFSAAMTGNVFAERSNDTTAATTAPLPWEEARLLAEVYARIKRDYVEDIDDKKLLENAVRGMVSALDPHSTFLDSEEFEEIRLSTMGSYPGVGIEVATENNRVKIVRPIEGSPAEEAGLLAGDVIVKIDDVEVGSDVSAAISRMRGKAGTKVKLSITRPGTEGIMDFVLERAHVEVRSVQQKSLEPGYGYVRITNFNERTPRDLDRAVARLKRENPNGLRGLVLDLRNNPGGVLESGVAVADAFLEKGVIVTADGRASDAKFRMDATPGDLIDGANLVVLVNSGSASAAEIVAGALKDHGRAELIGHKTYGKGSVQTVMPLSRGALKLTTSRYYTPSGVSIHQKGIMPDIISEGREEPPADIGSDKGASLVERDREVRLALDTLKAASPAVARSTKGAPAP